MTAETVVVPAPRRGDEVAWVAEHLGSLTLEGAAGVRASSRFRGTQAAADAALAGLSIAGYAARRNEVAPASARGATGLSPWIRHGLITLPRAWAAVDDRAPQIAAVGSAGDRQRFRDELLWQEYARHVYARLGAATRRDLRVPQLPPAGAAQRPIADPWDRTMTCVATNLDELERDGWVVNQARMWLASHWSVRHGAPWLDGEERFFRHLLDGSRAANRLGWQWTAGTATGRPYGFSRQQVQRRAPGLCQRCPHRDACPIEDWPAVEEVAAPVPAGLRRDDDPTRTAGPATVARLDPGAPDAVWITAESLGDDDPALAAHPDTAAVFVFDRDLLERLRLSGKRLVFLAERLAELAETRPLEVLLGDPVGALAGRRVAATFTPVPGWRRWAARLAPVEVHPWPWLRRPSAGPAGSFTAWVGRTARRSA